MKSGGTFDCSIRVFREPFLLLKVEELRLALTLSSLRNGSFVFDLLFVRF